MKNPDFARVKHLIETGFIKEFAGIFDSLQKKMVYKGLHMGPVAFDRRLEDPGLFTIHELAALALLIGVEAEAISTMATRARKKKGKR